MTCRMNLPHSFKKINLFKLKTFRHLFYQYVFIILSLITILFFFVYSYVLNLKQEKDNLLADNFMSLKAELTKEKTVIDTLTDELFFQQPYLEDLGNFISLDYGDYFEFKTDRYMADDASSYLGTLNFVKKVFYTYPNCVKIVFYNTDNQHVRLFSNTDGDYLQYLTAPFPERSINTKQLVSLLNLENDKSDNYISFHKTLNNPASLDNVAEMYYIFDLSNLYEELTKKNRASSGELFLYNEGELLFATNPDLDGEKLKTIQIDNVSGNYQLVSKENPDKLLQQVYFVYFYFALVSVLIVLLAIPLSFKHLRQFDYKLGNIINKMTAIQNGEFDSFTAPVASEHKGDELDVINVNLDKMALQLKKYIDNVYVSQIKQKNYQMKTLRAQINPHFLYNTLESIRMKAVINHDDDVAEMLFTASRLYKNMIKGKELTTLKDELSLCDSYLRLFEIRFEDRLFYDISFSEEIEEALIEKLSIQPLIENYVVHGIKQEEDNNFIEIACTKEKTDILIQVQDNGKGISEEKLKQINQQLVDNDVEASDSMGLLNVHQRIKELFGEQYGVSVAGNEWGGTTVSLRIPFQVREEFN